jgi:N utilization substance protein B
VKTAHDPRHLKRIQTVTELFAQSFQPQPSSGETKEVLTNLTAIDEAVAKAAPNRPLEQMNRIDLAILRLGAWEILYTTTKPSIIIDEAVEIAKEYGADASPKLIHAVLSEIVEHKP